jgi:Flp pilus assembly secretin CpaC
MKTIELLNSRSCRLILLIALLVAPVSSQQIRSRPSRQPRPLVTPRPAARRTTAVKPPPVLPTAQDLPPAQPAPTPSPVPAPPAAPDLEARKLAEELARQKALALEQEQAAREAHTRLSLQLEQSAKDLTALRGQLADTKTEAERQSQAARDAAQKQQGELEATRKLGAEAEEARRQAETARLEAEAKARLKADEVNRLTADLARRESAEKDLRQQLENSQKDLQKAEEQRLEQAKVRRALIIAQAQALHFVAPESAPQLVSDAALTPEAVTRALTEAVAANPKLARHIVFCDAAFSSPEYRFDLPSEVPLSALLDDIRYRFGVGFLPDAEIVSTPVRVNVTGVPWHDVLRSVLDFNELAADCLGPNVIRIVKRSKLAAIQDNRRKAAPLLTEFIKLRYLQPTSGGQVNVASKPLAGGGNAFESLEQAINRVLRADGDQRGSATRVPGRNELIITATEEQLKQIKAIIERADRPSYQVIVQALAYTSNESKLRDIGSQASIVLGTADRSTNGGFLSQPPVSNTSNGNGNSNPPATGGVPSLGGGFGQPANTLSAGSPNGLFGVSTILGTAQFSYQATLLAQRGVINIQSRPFALVQDGETVTLDVGRQIPIIIQGVLGGGGLATGGNLEILNAGSVLQVTPQVAEDDTGKPVSVTLNLRLESNDVDTSVITQGVPAVTRRSLQSKFLVGESQTVIFGGLSADSVSETRQKVPGVSDLPVIGNLFRRKTNTETRNRLYFAISVRIIPQGQTFETVPAPPDATPQPVPAPPAQKPSPFGASLPPTTPAPKKQPE